MRARRSLLAGIGAVAALAAALAAALPAQSPASEPSEFSRFVDDGAGGGHFDIAATTYQKGDVTVTLYASVHVADAAHYQELQRRFQGLDALLYEFVGNPALAPRPGTDWRDEPALGINLDVQLQLALELEAKVQFEVLDYRQENFVHADFDALHWLRHKKQCERELTELNAQDHDDDGRPDRDAIEAAFGRGEGHHLLRMWRGRSFAQAKAPPRPGMMVIEGRNDHCLSVLQQRIEQGDRRLGIYYGFLHLPHLERRLVQDLGFQRTAQQWLVALDCTKRPDDAETTRRWRAYLTARQLHQRADAVPAPAGTAPTLALLREQGPLPDDGKDPWGRDYLLRVLPRRPFLEVRSSGKDGEMDSFDDVVDSEQPSLRSFASLQRRESQRQAAKDAADKLRALFGLQPKPPQPVEARPPADVRGLRTRADAMRIRAAVEQWRLAHGTARLPGIADLQRAEPGSAPLLVGCDRDAWGGEWRIELQDGEVVVSSSGADGKPDTADDVRS